MRSKFPSQASPGILLVTTLLVSGCWGVRDDRPTCYPVCGNVLVNGKPASGARVSLTAVGDDKLARLGPHAEVGADGSFRITTFRTGDGAPPGRYAFTLSWPLPPRPGMEVGPDRFKGRYADPKHPLQQVEIVAGENDLGTISVK